MIPLDEKRMVAQFAQASRSRFTRFSEAWEPLRPRAPANQQRTAVGERWKSGQQRARRGATLLISIHATGALFQAGDGHAGQGDGEIDITAMETSLVGTFQFFVRKDMHLRWPRAETPTAFITMGLDEDLTAATKMAVREMINFLVQEKHMTRDEA